MQLIDADQARIAAGADRCAQVCDDGCHGDLVCQRAAHPHDPGNVTPHVGRDASGQMVQWTCLPGDRDSRTAGERKAEAAKVRAAATHSLLDQVDPALLVQLLKAGGHL